MVIGQQKGRDTKQKLFRNFGMPNPDGYRKALRLMKLAAKFGRPVITMLDTPGAFPGLEAEERGQAEAIARNLREMAALRVPILSVVTGEGGSGGALALGVGNRIFMLENAIYSVISPESCAAIVWRDSSKAELAAAATDEAKAKADERKQKAASKAEDTGAQLEKAKTDAKPKLDALRATDLPASIRMGQRRFIQLLWNRTRR